MFFCYFVLICCLAICSTYVNIDIAQLLNKPFLFAQTFTFRIYVFWEGASFFKTFMLTLKSSYTSLRLQVFLQKICTYAVSVDIAHLLNNLFLFVMQTFKLLYASLKLQVFFFANLWLSEMLFYAVKINIAYSLNRSFLFAMQTIKSLYVSPKLQVFFC